MRQALLEQSSSLQQMEAKCYDLTHKPCRGWRPRQPISQKSHLMFLYTNYNNHTMLCRGEQCSPVSVTRQLPRYPHNVSLHNFAVQQHFVASSGTSRTPSSTNENRKLIHIIQKAMCFFTHSLCFILLSFQCKHHNSSHHCIFCMPLSLTLQSLRDF